MSDLKSMYNRAYVESLADSIAAASAQCGHGFVRDEFVATICATLDSLEMKDRVRLIARTMRVHLPQRVPDAIALLVSLLGPPAAMDDPNWADFKVWPHAMYVERYGVEHFEVSLDALHAMTQWFTAEWAIRPFLVQQPKRTLAVLRGWTSDESHHVRRLVSEGTRTRLPWGARLVEFVGDPSEVLKLLELLKDDETEYVRRSVANNLNDLAKDHPDRIVALTKKWMKGASKERQKLIRHALRTLVKEGHRGALEVLGYSPDVEVDVAELSVSSKVVLGSKLELSFELVNRGKTKAPVIVDFVVHHVKKNGQRSPKVFKLKTVDLPGDSRTTMRKKHPMKPATTRKYYSGEHQVDIMVNGVVKASQPFELVVN